MNNFTNNEGKNYDFFNPNIIPFEPDYEDIKTNPQKIFNKYYKQIVGTMCTISYWKNYDRDELIQDSYEIVLQLCKDYDPYYNGKFMQFDKYLFRNLIMQQRAKIQKYFLTKSREISVEHSAGSGVKENSINGTVDSISDIHDKLLLVRYMQYLTPNQKHVLELSVQKMKFKEISEITNIQSAQINKLIKHSTNVLKKCVKALEEG